MQTLYPKWKCCNLYHTQQIFAAYGVIWFFVHPTSMSLLPISMSLGWPRTEMASVLRLGRLQLWLTNRPKWPESSVASTLHKSIKITFLLLQFISTVVIFIETEKHDWYWRFLLLLLLFTTIATQWRDQVGLSRPSPCLCCALIGTVQSLGPRVYFRPQLPLQQASF